MIGKTFSITHLGLILVGSHIFKHPIVAKAGITVEKLSGNKTSISLRIKKKTKKLRVPRAPRKNFKSRQDLSKEKIAPSKQRNICNQTE